MVRAANLPPRPQRSAPAQHSTDQNARAIPPARLDTNRRASRTRDNESARRSHTQNRAAPAVSRPASPRALSKRRPVAAEYARTPRNARAALRPVSVPPHCPAIPPFDPPPRVPEMSRPATARTETPCRLYLRPEQTAPRDGTAHNVHRKKDIPRQGPSTPPEKHSTSAHRVCVNPHAGHAAPPQVSTRRVNRNCGNATAFALASVSENL
jgi:hypothetical protein